MRRAVQHFKRNGVQTEEVGVKLPSGELFIDSILFVFQFPMQSLQHLVEGGLAKFFSMEDVPLIVRHLDNPKKLDNVYFEMFKAMFGKSKYTFAGLFFVFLYYTRGFIAKRKIPKHIENFDATQAEFEVQNETECVLALQQTNNNFYRLFAENPR